MDTQDLVTALTGLFIAGMVWVRTRMHYVHRRGLKLKPAGRVYFAALIAVLAVGWFVAPSVGNAVWPAGGADSTIMRVLWFLLTYYLFIIVHRTLKGRRIEVFSVDESL
ncbi:MAG: hypothetical protein ACRETB_03360 [Steroidobacteraceae bacterium]